MLRIPKLKLKDLSAPSIEEAMRNVDSQNIDVNNWPSQYPYSPTVQFKIAHDGDNIFLRYTVKEKEVLAAARGNNSEVWTDSCVEFFISFDDSGNYYNLEQSCIGQVLLGYRKGRNDSIHATDAVLDALKRYPSLGYSNIELRSGDFEWSLLTIIPVKSFWENNIPSLDGIRAKANFYKCGDNLTTPHYLSWAPIATEKPNFHKPEFFEEIIFEG